jgi:ubiquinone/menaquinone biosynthesis C-methylase UbiE
MNTRNITEQLNDIISENRTYWSHRAPGYSEVNKRELSSDQKDRWKNFIKNKIETHFTDKNPGSVSVLEVGTGPGFFAIILSECGYKVTAVDLTPSMLEEARNNAGDLADRIHFMEMNAEELTFDDEVFDVVISRNLTWNLPHPEIAYRQWCRVLKKGGLLLNFDANWYSYLFDTDAAMAYEEDRHNTSDAGFDDMNVGEGFDIMEEIARRVPLSSISRPAWDTDILTGLMMDCRPDISTWQKVWSEEEKISFRSTPMFLVEAVKN